MDETHRHRRSTGCRHRPRRRAGTLITPPPSCSRSPGFDDIKFAASESDRLNLEMTILQLLRLEHRPADPWVKPEQAASWCRLKRTCEGRRNVADKLPAARPPTMAPSADCCGLNAGRCRAAAPVAARRSHPGIRRGRSPSSGRGRWRLAPVEGSVGEEGALPSHLLRRQRPSRLPHPFGQAADGRSQAQGHQQQRRHRSPHRMMDDNMAAGRHRPRRPGRHRLDPI